MKLNLIVIVNGHANFRTWFIILYRCRVIFKMLNMIQENNAICCLFPQVNVEGLLKKEKEETRESKKKDGKSKKYIVF